MDIFVQLPCGGWILSEVKNTKVLYGFEGDIKQIIFSTEDTFAMG